MLANRRRSKHQLECELHRPWAARLIKRIQLADRVRQCRGSLPKCRLPELAIDRPNIRVIEDIEGFCPELQFHALGNGGEDTANSHIYLPDLEPGGEIVRDISRPGGRSECIGIDGSTTAARQGTSKVCCVYGSAVCSIDVDGRGCVVQPVRLSLTGRGIVDLSP